jgi:hypothetical protein
MTGSSARRVFRFEVPIDGAAHRVAIPDDAPRALAAGSARFDPVDRVHRVVELWVEVNPVGPKRYRLLRAFATGEPLPAGARWIGTTQRTPEGFVWHLYELDG